MCTWLDQKNKNDRQIKFPWWRRLFYDILNSQTIKFCYESIYNKMKNKAGRREKTS